MLTGFDPRAVANLILDQADQLGFSLSNLALQKLLYLTHSIYLVQTGKPLVQGYFEAWRYGPVHPAVYQCFKNSGSGPIHERAEALNPVTFERSHIPSLSQPELNLLITRVVSSFGRLTPGQLVDVTHAKDGPWDFVIRSASESAQIGLRIPDRVIVERFKYHKVPVGPVAKAGEPDEDSPFA